MPRRPRLAPYLLLGLALPLVLAAAGDDANWKRLRSMPREHRLILSEKLKEFDQLSRDEQARIRDLDRRLADLPPADQATYRSVLRRYHIWFRSLPDDQRAQVEAAPAAGKLAVVSRLRAVPRRGDDKGPSPLPFQLADLRGRSPFELAHMLEIWFRISPEQRSEVEEMGARDRMRRLFELARQAKVPPPAGLSEEKAAEVLRDLEKNVQVKGFLRSQLRKMADPEKFLVRKVEVEKFLIDRRRLANNYYFLANPPKPVSSSNLLKFEAAMPSWFRSTFDHLPPDEARRRLTVLYRLIYPPPKEIPAAGPYAVKPAAPEPAPAKSRPRPNPGPAGTVPPPL